MSDVPNCPPTILSHLSLGTNRLEEAKVFYDAVMAALGAKRLIEHPGAVAYGRKFPEFWLGVPFDGKAATVGNGTHVAFFAYNKEQVDAFHAAALAAGGTDDGAPGPRPHYGEAYYGGFVRDLDGNKIEAMFWDMSKA